MEVSYGPLLKRWASSIVVAVVALGGLALGSAAVDGITSLWFAPTAEHAKGPGEDEPYEDFSIPLASGEELDAWWFPAQGSGHVLGVVVHAHGNAGNLSYQWSLVSGLAPRGFHVLCYDYRGFGRSGGGPPERRQAIEDTHAALDLGRQRALDEGVPLYLFGQSIGGAIALEAALERDDLTAVAVDAPFSSWPGIADHHMGTDPLVGPVLRTLLFTLFQRERSEPIEAAAQLELPLLIIGGTEDRICPVGMARAIHDGTGGHSRLLVIQGADHVGLREEAHHERMLEGVSRHFQDAAVKAAGQK